MLCRVMVALEHVFLYPLSKLFADDTQPFLVVFFIVKSSRCLFGVALT